MSVFDQLRGVSCMDAARCLGIAIKREYRGAGWAMCPIHGETGHPSLFLSDTRGWYCYGCHKGGDAVRLYQEVTGAEPLDAAHALAGAMGIPVEDDGRRLLYVTPRDLEAGLKKHRKRLQRKAAKDYLAADDAINEKISSVGMEACWDEPGFHELLQRRDAAQSRLDDLLECSDEDILAMVKEERSGKT